MAKSSKRYSGLYYGTLPPEDATRVLEVNNVSVTFGKRQVLEEVTFHVPVGEFLCLCGPNGAGKSTGGTRSATSRSGRASIGIFRRPRSRWSWPTCAASGR